MWGKTLRVLGGNLMLLRLSKGGAAVALPSGISEVRTRQGRTSVTSIFTLAQNQPTEF